MALGDQVDIDKIGSGFSGQAAAGEVSVAPSFGRPVSGANNIKQSDELVVGSLANLDELLVVISAINAVLSMPYPSFVSVNEARKQTLIRACDETVVEVRPEGGVLKIGAHSREGVIHGLTCGSAFGGPYQPTEAHSCANRSRRRSQG
jgi:hypothetical protein